MNTDVDLKRKLANAGMLVALTCLLSSPAAAQSKGDAAAGLAVAKERCVLCHGPDGNGNKASAMYQRGDLPRIADLPERYFIKSLLEYKRGQRPHVGMQSSAEYLSDKDMRDVAAWYASQPPSATATYEYKIQ